MSKNQNSNQKKVFINEDAKEFAKARFKKYKKKYSDIDTSKKQLKKDFKAYLLDRLPGAVEFVIKYGYINDEKIKETKNNIFYNLINNDIGLIEYIEKILKKDGYIEGIEYLPIVIREIVTETNKINTKILEEDPNGKIYDVDDLVNIVPIILKKKFKKFEKAGIDNKLAYDVLTIMPDTDAIKLSTSYRIRLLFDTLYEHAKVGEIAFDKIAKILFKKNDYPIICTYAMLERREKFTSLTEQQQKFYLAVNDWILNNLEHNFDTDVTDSIIRRYTAVRRKDDEKNKDTNRRFNLSSIPEADYPNISAIVKRMISKDDSVKKYL